MAKIKNSARVPDGAVGGEWFADTEEIQRYIEEHGTLLGQMAEPLTALFTPSSPKHPIEYFK